MRITKEDLIKRGFYESDQYPTWETGGINIEFTLTNRGELEASVNYDYMYLFRIITLENLDRFLSCIETCNTPIIS